MFKTSDFNYNLPESLIAQKPAYPRDTAKLMIVDRNSGNINHYLVRDLPHIINDTYTIVVNNTKVFPARLYGHKPTGGKVEILLLKPLGNNIYNCITSPGLDLNQKIIFANNLSGKCIFRHERITHILFDSKDQNLENVLIKIGKTPVPPYIHQKAELKDYQTIYAKEGFSAAAPTAGLHFTKKLLNTLDSKNKIHELTLNVGLGTFLPVKEDIIENHKMHSESYSINKNLADYINNHKNKKGKILAIGTTTTRALESSTNNKGLLLQTEKETDIYIYPPYKFQIVDAILTNFHLPHSTLLMMISAFASYPNTSSRFTTFKESLIGRAYKEAIQNNYRFYSFGDAMLIL